MKQKNKPITHETLSNDLKEEKSKKGLLERFLDVSIVLLLVVIVFLSLRIFKNSDYFENFKEGTLKSFAFLKKDNGDKSPTSKTASSNRKYPDYITEDQKVVLRPQSNDQSTEDTIYWSDLVNKLATSSNKLTLRKYGEDCFGEPVVLKLDANQKVQLVNDNNSEITLGYGDKSWRVPAKSSLDINFDLAPLESNQDNMLGYGCGNSNEPSGLVLVEF